MLEWMGLNFYYYDGLQPKMREGIINEHECIASQKYLPAAVPTISKTPGFAWH